MTRRHFQHLLASMTATPLMSATRGKTTAPGTLIGMQYENWFVPGSADWSTAESIPILGKYNSFDAKVMRKHFEWFEWLGIDWLLIDWSNMLWSKPAWEEHTGGTRQLEKSVAFMVDTCLQLRKEGKYAPKLVFMLGLQNGPQVPNGMARLNGILAWLQKTYLDPPEYRDLWLYYSSKPFLTILYWPRDPCTQLPEDLKRTPLKADAWTIRWMSSQLQDSHAERCGMWSWMDGTIRQKVTMQNGTAEETVVTPACFTFPGKGWTHPGAVGRGHGGPYLESWKVAFENRPKFIQIHQWNEFAGQKEGQGFPSDYWGEKGGAGTPSTNVFGDEYSPHLSDDLEPTDLAACGYRGCGGWGYYYLNLTKALVSLYRGETPGVTIMALTLPLKTSGIRGDSVPVAWTYVGAKPKSYTVALDGVVVASNLTSSEFNLNLKGAAAGKHVVEVRADGAQGRYSLSPERQAGKSSSPLPVAAAMQFTLLR